MKDLAAQVCIIGSGVAGGIVSQELLRAGLKDIVMVEMGEAAPMRDQRAWLDYVMSGQSFFGFPRVFENLFYPEQDYVNQGSEFVLKYMALRTRGGSTVGWGGDAFRLKPEDFRLRSLTGQGVDWPISYDDLETFYQKAESTLQVAGDWTDAGHPPRTTPFPLGPFDITANEQLFVNSLKALGYSSQHNCVSRNSDSINGMPACQFTSTCWYCPIGGRFTGDQLIDQLEAQAGFKLLLRTTALRLGCSSRKRAAYLEVLDQRSQKPYRLESELFVLCAGAINTPALLLASTNSSWPRGIGNNRELVGKYLFNHWQQGAISSLPNNREDLFTQLAFGTACSRHFDDTSTQSVGKFILNSFTNWPPLIPLMMQQLDSSRIKVELASSPLPISVAGWGEEFPVPESRVSLGPRRDSSSPKVAIHYVRHDLVSKGVEHAKAVQAQILKQMGGANVDFMPTGMMAHPGGTCRMGLDPETGVVDPDLRVHGMDNVFVCSSAVFPSGGAANPTLTIAALAHRLGERLVDQLF